MRTFSEWLRIDEVAQPQKADFIGYHCSEEPRNKMALNFKKGIAPHYSSPGIKEAWEVENVLSALPANIRKLYPTAPGISDSENGDKPWFWSYSNAARPESQAKVQWASQVVKQLEAAGYRWIFISESVLDPYGAHCYSVYLPKSQIYGQYNDRYEEDATVYIFNVKTGMPKFVPLSTSEIARIHKNRYGYA
jgi:hypothetical protein